MAAIRHNMTTPSPGMPLLALRAGNERGRVMNFGRTLSWIVLSIAFCSAVHADEKDRNGPKISDKVFRQTSSLFLNDPSNRSARDWARLIMLYTLDRPNADVVLGREELSWAGIDKEDARSLLLLAAYAAGNIQSQLNSGVKRNDRYSGVLTLFRVYRALREQDEKFEVSAVDNLLALHQEGKLVPHLQKLAERKPTKLTPVGEQAIRDLMRTR